MYFYGFTSVDDQKQIPIVHPVINHEYVFAQPVLGGELSHPQQPDQHQPARAPNFDAITPPAAANGLVHDHERRPERTRPPTIASCAASPATTRAPRPSCSGGAPSSIRSARCSRRSCRCARDVASVDITGAPGVSNFTTPGQNEVARFMPTAGVEYRYPFINVQSWGTQTIEPIAQFVVRPNETNIGALPNEDSQSFMFDASNLFRVQQVRGLGSRRGRRAAQCRRPVHRPVQSGRLPQRPGRAVLPSVRTEFVRGGEPDQYRPRQRTGQGAVRLRRARGLPAQLAALAHLALPLRRGRPLAAAIRIRGDVQLRALDDHGHVRLLRAAAGDRLPGRAAKASPRPPGSSCRRTGRHSAASGTTCGPISSTRPRSAWATSTTASSWP